MTWLLNYTTLVNENVVHGVLPPQNPRGVLENPQSSAHFHPTEKSTALLFVRTYQFLFQPTGSAISQTCPRRAREASSSFGEKVDIFVY